MIVYEGPGDLFKAKERTLVCTVNVVGAMGKGVALEFKRRFPGLYEEYLETMLFDGHRKLRYTSDMIERNRNTLLFWTPPEGGPHDVLCFPTKLHWMHDSPLELIEENLALLARNYASMGITSLAMPPLGCGNGNRDYKKEVGPLIHQYFGDSVPIPVAVYFG